MSTIARDPLGIDRVPVGPGMSMFDPMFIGIDEFGKHVMLDLPYHNLLIAGEPGGGKSGLVNLAAGTAALCENTRLVLLDAKFVELGLSGYSLECRGKYG
jgi:S-DNA-T family DNA segregation ATPase FtsK/SpoIIIE